jgi:hypothetical protein
MFDFVLLAAIEDWLKFAIPLVFFIIYALNQLLTASKSKAATTRENPPRRRPEGAERPLQPSRQQTAQPTGGQAQLNAEIEQFLKRAGERRGDRMRRESPVKPAPKSPPKPPPREQPRDAESPRREFDNLATSVEKHLGDRGFKQRAEHLADDIVRADQQMEDHMQKAFSRKVGTLSEGGAIADVPVTDSSPVAVTEHSETAVALAALLSNPQTLKQMIVLNEILTRPEIRW